MKKDKVFSLIPQFFLRIWISPFVNTSQIHQVATIEILAYINARGGGELIPSIIDPCNSRVAYNIHPRA